MKFHRYTGNKMKGPVLVLLLFLASPAWSQIKQVARYEREHKHSTSPLIVISMRENGIALVTDTEKYQDGQKVYEVAILDTALNDRGVINVQLQNRFQIIGYDFAGDYLYLLFRAGETDAGDLRLIELSVATKEVQHYEIKHEFIFRLTHFSIVNKSMVLGGYVSREPAVLIFDIPTGQLKVVPGFFTSDTELLDLRVNQNRTFNTLVTNRASREKRILLLRTFDHRGLQLLEDEIEIEENKTILSALTSSLVRDELLIAGTYAAGISKQATGFFSVLADPFEEQPIQYYDFAQLSHFLDYLNPRRAEKIRSISKRYREHGRDPQFRCYVSNVRLEERPEGFFLLAEVYNMSTGTGSTSYQGWPLYTPYGTSSPYSPFSNRYYNSPYTYNNQPQNDDVNVLESSVVVFAPDGKLEWDHSLKLKGGQRPRLEQLSDFWCNRNKIVIANKKEEELMIKMRYKNSETLSDTVKTLTRNPTDIIRNDADEDGGVRHWYENKFYVWGYQTIKDRGIQFEDGVRSVFYIIKVDAY